MKSTTMTAGMPVGEKGRVYDLGDLYVELDKVTDKRKARGKRHCLAWVLLLIILAKIGPTPWQTGSVRTLRS